MRNRVASHTAPALILLGGWLIMLAPYKREAGQLVADPTAPLAQWRLDDDGKIYESAAACRAELSATWREAALAGPQLLRALDRAQLRELKIGMRREVRCVPAELVRPEKPPVVNSRR